MNLHDLTFNQFKQMMYSGVEVVYDCGHYVNRFKLDKNGRINGETLLQFYSEFFYLEECDFTNVDRVTFDFTKAIKSEIDALIEE